MYRDLRLYVNIPKGHTLSISFESSVFRDGWSGVIEFQFKKEKARQFHDVLKSIGARQGAPIIRLIAATQVNHQVHLSSSLFRLL